MGVFHRLVSRMGRSRHEKSSPPFGSQFLSTQETQNKSEKVWFACDSVSEEQRMATVDASTYSRLTQLETDPGLPPEIKNFVKLFIRIKSKTEDKKSVGAASSRFEVEPPSAAKQSHKKPKGDLLALATAQAETGIVKATHGKAPMIGSLKTKQLTNPRCQAMIARTLNSHASDAHKEPISIGMKADSTSLHPPSTGITQGVVSSCIPEVTTSQTADSPTTDRFYTPENNDIGLGIGSSACGSIACRSMSFDSFDASQSLVTPSSLSTAETSFVDDPGLIEEHDGDTLYIGKASEIRITPVRRSTLIESASLENVPQKKPRFRRNHHAQGISAIKDSIALEATAKHPLVPPDLSLSHPNTFGTGIMAGPYPCITVRHTSTAEVRPRKRQRLASLPVGEFYP